MPTYLDVEDYKIHDLAAPGWGDRKCYQFDFARHLKPDVALQKNVIYLSNGRPDYAVYSHGGVDYARIKWTFTNHPDSYLMATRKVECAYYLDSGTLGDYFTIKDEAFDPSIPHHRKKMIEERVQGRQTILNDLKAAVMGTLAALYPLLTEDEVTEMGAELWQRHGNEISNFIETGSKDIATAIQLDSLTLWLDDTMDPGPPAVTIGEYIVFKLNY